MKIRSIFFLLLVAVAGCKKPAAAPAGSVVLYTSVDEPYVRPLVDQFQKETGITVRLVTDAEASKSVGLAEKLRAERDHVQADVWWDNECFLSVGLANDGILAPYDSPAAADIPAEYKDPNHLWAGSVLRVRVMVSSPTLGADRPTHLRDLLNPKFKNQIVLARPTAGTTGGHVAALYSLWGQPAADQFFQSLALNGAIMVGGNSVAADQVGHQGMLVGLCDNDDAASTVSDGGKLDITLPDQGDNEPGTLAMPCAVSLVNGAPDQAQANRLIDFLLSKQTDKSLVDAKFAWCSARDSTGRGKFMPVDYRAVTTIMPVAIRQVTAKLDHR